MNPKNPNYLWILGLETKKVHCPDGQVRVMTYKEFIDWLMDWSEKGIKSREQNPSAT